MPTAAQVSKCGQERQQGNQASRLPRTQRKFAGDPDAFYKAHPLPLPPCPTTIRGTSAPRVICNSRELPETPRGSRGSVGRESEAPTNPVGDS